LLFLFIGCGSVPKNKPLSNISSFTAANVRSDIAVGVSLDYGDGTNTTYLKRLSPLRKDSVSKFNKDANLNNNRIRFIEIGSYVNPFLQNSD